MNIDKTNTLYSNGTLQELYKAGFLSNKIFIYREIYNWVIERSKTAKNQCKKRRIIADAALKFNTSDRTVLRAMNCFNSDSIVS